MQVRLSPKLQEFVRHLVDVGEFESVDHVIAHALTEFAERDLRRLVEEGVNDFRAGRFEEWDIEQVKRDFLRRWKRSKKKAS